MIYDLAQSKLQQIMQQLEWSSVDQGGPWASA
jgi:hypothetical protein